MFLALAFSIAASAARWKLFAWYSYLAVFRALRNWAALLIRNNSSALAWTLARSFRASPSSRVWDSLSFWSMSGSGSRFFFSCEEEGTASSGRTRAADRRRRIGHLGSGWAAG